LLTDAEFHVSHINKEDRKVGWYKVRLFLFVLVSPNTPKIRPSNQFLQVSASIKALQILVQTG